MVNDVIREDEWIAPLMINGTVDTMTLDSGAKANLISMCDVKAMKNKQLIKVEHCLDCSFRIMLGCLFPPDLMYFTRFQLPFQINKSRKKTNPQTE